MRVKAKSLGYYANKRQRPGSVFNLVPYKHKNKDGVLVTVSAKEQFSKHWMVELKGKPKYQEPEDDLEDSHEDEVAEDSQEVI